MSNRWKEISSAIARNTLIEEYVRRKLADLNTPAVSESRSIRNVQSGILNGYLTSEDFIMGEESLLEIKNTKFDNGEIIVIPRRRKSESPAPNEFRQGRS